jgi:hypothetical protein
MTTKACVNCKHYRYEDVTGNNPHTPVHQCHRAAEVIDLVTGTVSEHPVILSCSQERYNTCDGYCGHSGKYYRSDVL